MLAKNKTAITLALFLIFLIIPAVSAKDISLKFYSSSSPQTFTVYKGGYVDIPVTVANQDSVSMICTIGSSSSSLSSKTTDSLQGGYKQDINFRYSAPSKIKNLQSASITFTTNCVGPSAYSCGVLWSDTCKYISTPITHSVTINYALNAQDQQNLEALENYRKGLTPKITSVDANLKTLKDLIDKNPSLLKPVSTPSDYDSAQNKLNNIRKKFDEVVKYIEQEEYSFALNYNSPSIEVGTLTEVDNNVASIQNVVNKNIEKYKELTNQFNTISLENNELIRPHTTQSNSNFVENYNSITTSLQEKLTKYQFSSLEEVSKSIEDYRQQSQEIISQLKEGETTAIKSADNLLKLNSQVFVKIKVFAILKITLMVTVLVRTSKKYVI